MALFHSTTKIISRSDAGNAVAAAAYRSGTRMTCARTGQVFNYTRKREVTYRAILAPADSPAWVFDRTQLADAIEASETRKNSQLWREVQMALPIQLTSQQHIQLLTEYVQEQFINRGMVACIALHDKKTGNPHVHILLTLRDITLDGFGAKRRDWNDKALVIQWREAWATACNAALEQAGSTERILFGSDFPLYDQGVTIAELDAAAPRSGDPFTQGDLRAVLESNGETFLDRIPSIFTTPSA